MIGERASSAQGQRQVRTRAIALGVFVSAVFLLLASQLFYLQVIKGWEYKRQIGRAHV